MMRWPAVLLLALFLIPTSATADCELSALPEGTEIARLELSVGTVCLELLRDDAPGHVENFLWYLEREQLTDTFFHRYVGGFVLQGGSFRVGTGDYESVPTRPDHIVFNEPCTPDPKAPIPGSCSERGNETGTVALAKLSGDANSGTTGWFINLSDNHSLDTTNGGFTVFARVTPDTMAVVESVASLPAATPDDNYWLHGTLKNSSVWRPRLTQPPNRSLPGLGCFDGASMAAIANPENPGAGLDDPSTGTFPWIVSSACGTPIALGDFVANPGTKACPDDDRLAVGLTGPASLQFTTDPPSYFRLTCEQEVASRSQRPLFREAFQAEFDSRLIFIESAEHVLVPEPSAAALSVAAVAVLGSLCHRERRGRGAAERS